MKHRVYQQGPSWPSFTKQSGQSVHSLSRPANTSKPESTLGSGCTVPQLNRLQLKLKGSVALLTGKLNSSSPSPHWKSLLNSCPGTVFHRPELLSHDKYQLYLFFRVLLTCEGAQGSKFVCPPHCSTIFFSWFPSKAWSLAHTTQFWATRPLPNWGESKTQRKEEARTCSFLIYCEDDTKHGANGEWGRVNTA